MPRAEPDSLGNDQIESEEILLEARVDDKTGKHSKMEPERKYFTLESSLQRDGTGVEAPK